MSFSFFGDVDKNAKGGVGSEFPAWIMNAHIEELEESVAQKERAEKSGVIAIENLPYHREALAKEKKRLREIKQSKPKLTEKQYDKVTQEYGKLKNFIADSLFTRSQMKLGLADAHEEARRMVDPIIAVDRTVANACNIKPRGGKVSRNEATKMYKIIGNFIGDQTNAEYLRKNG